MMDLGEYVLFNSIAYSIMMDLGEYVLFNSIAYSIMVDLGEYVLFSTIDLLDFFSQLFDLF